MDTEHNALEHAQDAELVVRFARWKLTLVFVPLLLMDALILVYTFGFPLSIHLSFNQVMALVILSPLTAALIVCVFGLFSPQPVLSINHAGIRTHTFFGLFGTHLIPWAHVKAVVTYKSDWQRWLKIYSDNREPMGCWELLRRRLGPGAAIPRAWVSSGMIAGSMDALLEHMEQRYGTEIDAHGVLLIDQGADSKDHSASNWDM